MVYGGFLSVCPIHLYFLFFISCSMGSGLVSFHSVVLDTLSVHFRCKILCKHLLMEVCIIVSVFCVLRHVSDPQGKTPLTYEFNILNFVLILICFALQIFLNMMNAALNNILNTKKLITYMCIVISLLFEHRAP